jgi:hypothetical protein
VGASRAPRAPRREGCRRPRPAHRGGCPGAARGDPPRRQVERVRVLADEGDRLRREIDGVHRRVGTLVLDRQRDGTAPRGHVDHRGRLRLRQAVERHLDEDLGLRPRHEDAWPHTQVQPPEPLRSRHVLERLSDTPPAESPSEELRLLRREPLPGIHPGPVGAEDVGQEPLRGRNRTLHTVPVQVLGRAFDDLRRSHVSLSRPASPTALPRSRPIAPNARRRSAAR